jgi:beta-glucanase (GH16 family)
MKTRYLLLGACALLLGGGGRAHAQQTPNQDHLHTYKTTPVWSDEFDGSAVNPDNWVFETTDKIGVLNNELQYYQAGGANTSVANGRLTITARQQSVGSLSYTSARMKTKGLQDIRFGRVEARIELPQGNGLWPGFWMLGSNIEEATTNWPKCGEIDIVERVNQGDRASATEHWDSPESIADPAIKADNYPPGHKYYPTSIDMVSTGYHTYAMEWDENSIWTWVDGVKYHEFSIKGGINSTEEFQKRFFVLLNLAVGGNMPFGWWTGVSSVNNGALPATMNVEYVRVFERADAPVVSAQGLQLEAENSDYADMHIGKTMKAEACSEGGEDMGYIQAKNFLKFNVNFPGAGTYRLDYRVASGGTGGTISADLNGGAVPLGDTNVPGTGGWQTWQTVSKTFTVTTAGTYDLGIFAQTAGYNLNWIRLTAVSVSNPPPPPVAVSQQLFAVNANVQSAGMKPESCSEGGQDMGYLPANGFLVFNNITFPTTGNYLVEYRVASGGTGGSISFDLDANAVSLGFNTFGGTGGWQTWTTVSQTVWINAGTHNFGLNTQTAGYNLNWIRITPKGAARGVAMATAVNAPERGARQLQFYPNPVTTSFVVDGLREAGELTLRDYLGRTCLHKQVEANERVDISTVPAGIYFLTVRIAEGQLVQKLVKQ